MLAVPTFPFGNSVARDAMLTYAYRLYETPEHPPPGLSHFPMFNPSPASSPKDVYQAQLIPLLANLRSLHPNHLPTLLLLGCVYHAVGEYQSCLDINQQILDIDPNFVEAMCNIGTTMKAISRPDDAYEWWWRALERRPTYWDALDNLLQLILSPCGTPSGGSVDNEAAQSCYRKALQVCEYVQSKVVRDDGRLSISVPATQLCRLQNVFYTSSTLSRGLGNDGIRPLSLAIEIVIRPPGLYGEEECYSMRDLVLATILACLLITSNPGTVLPPQIESAMTSEGQKSFSLRAREPGYDLMHEVHQCGHKLAAALVPEGNGALPMFLLAPDQAMRLPHLIFPLSMGVLPSVCSRNEHNRLETPSESVRQQCHSMSSTILLGLSKQIQDAVPGSSLPVPSFEDKIKASPSLTLLLYYLALSLSPSPAIYNNMGLILSVLPVTANSFDITRRNSPSGVHLARTYYEKGLQLDSNHPHLLTNMGSLLKDGGQTSEAIRLYLRAIHYKPDFDIALANLGNAMKDLGRHAEAVSYYTRALKTNPALPEAICGLGTSLMAICDWRGRGGVAPDVMIDQTGNVIRDEAGSHPGWLTDMIDVCRKQLLSSYSHNIGIVVSTMSLEGWLDLAQQARGTPFKDELRRRWRENFSRFYSGSTQGNGYINEAGFVIRLIEWLQRRLQRKWYLQAYGKALLVERPVRPMTKRQGSSFTRPAFPASIGPPPVPSILPFHTFTAPLSVRTIRLISHRNALRVSHAALAKPWLPQHLYHPPAPPLRGKLNIGYVSSDLNNHPLAHLMQSVFGLHDKSRFNIFVYATSSSDGSPYRQKIESQTPHFLDVSSWDTGDVVDRIVQDQIHILVNLGGYTKGAKNELFAARPSPIQMSLMGFAGTLGAGWCDYLVCDQTTCPRYLSASEQWRKYIQRSLAEDTAEDKELGIDFDATPDPEALTESWMYTEKLLYMPHTYLVTDHKQSHRDDEGLSVEARETQDPDYLWRKEILRRTKLRSQIFPDIESDFVIFANFSQLYKICPATFSMWLKILERVPRSILWLLRFPAAGQEHLLRTASAWANDEVAARIRFTDVTDKHQHVIRGRVADLFLDTIECNAHTVAADALWSGTPLITWPRYSHKMASRVGASIVNATGFGDRMVVHSEEEYQDRAVFLANSMRNFYAAGGGHALQGNEQGALMDLRRDLFLARDRMPLFDTARWTRNLEKGFWEAWRRWVEGTEFEGSEEWEACDGPEKESGCIWISDDEPITLAAA
ncbi:hypothetical protein PUNSTDRAFT_140213 [Punctularia strigosozonata HHB-11173 SS5]|uniref:uncharacterized protein n=1 Tax=Punctularia strigosozonata (strain HHB-11173) TaxID=741275 RepID=UPI0004417113|nr:uncharacterized protein PUNSTDRAFT_140213 [Punctularia strigosozonata HHB-11173 SS5]EIN13738.1 hypothetical protein PUNSTDRAFT_140213 [Punctularia strigosozonata HHB-11173 SS5]